MNTSRLAPIPIDHVVAEISAYPLASVSSFKNVVTQLDPCLAGSTGPLWRKAERELLASWPAVSLDEFVALRDSLWFGERRQGSIPLVGYLRSLTGRFLEGHGTTAAPRLKLEKNPLLERARSRAAWRWLSLALPADLLLASFNRSQDYPLSVDTLSPGLRKDLEDSGFAECHLHLGAAADFPRLWVGALRALADSGVNEDCFRSPGAHFQEGKDLAAWMLRAAIARYVLAGFLSAAGQGSDFIGYLQNTVWPQIGRGALGGTGGVTLVTALEDLLQGGLSPKGPIYAALRALYGSMISNEAQLFPEEPDEVWTADPIAPLLPWSQVRGVTPEMCFVSRGLDYLERQSKDVQFAALFWQVVRVRCLFYRHLVQRPMTPGLQWFIRFFKRIRTAREPFSTKLRIRSAALLCGADQGLRSLEVRSGPESEVSVLLREVRDVEDGFHQEDCELGLVYHLARERGGEWLEGKPTAHWQGSHADPRSYHSEPKRGNPTGYRYARFYVKKRTEAQAIARLLSLFPLSLRTVRGVDLCTDESGVPTWVLAPLLRYVRDAGLAASSTLRRRFGKDVRPLRTTVHAGEDFVHLLSGLRRLDEAIEHLGVREGDRLGHALSLGVDPDVWCLRTGRVAMALEDRLFDLAWEWSWHARNGDGTPSERYVALQTEVAECSERMFGRTLEPRTVSLIVDNLHDERVLRHLSFPSGRPPEKVHKDYKYTLQYLCDPDVFDRGREIIWVDPAKEAKALKAIQEGLRRKAGTAGITIEVNPSSNLLIGHLADLGDHPLWRLRPPEGGDGVPPLSICIGSDDPLTFATTLPEEYQLLQDTLLLAGYSEAVAHDWIESARKAGLSARFTLRRDTAEKGDGRLLERRDTDERNDLCLHAVVSTPLPDSPP